MCQICFYGCLSARKGVFFYLVIKMKTYTQVRFFLGIDGGGTKTAFRFEDGDGNVLAELTLGPSNPNDVGTDGCKEVLKKGIDRVCAGVDLSEVAVFAGIAGGLAAKNKAEISCFLSFFNFGFCANGSDVDNALEAALSGGDGVAVIAGTGTVAFAQKNGERKRIGGWGYLIDSGGSGYNIGRDALEAALRDLDGRGERTLLTEKLSEHFGNSLPEAIPEIYSGGKRIIASLAPLVFEACEDGDGTAAAIIGKNAAAIAELINTAAGFCSDEGVRAVVCGGLSARADLITGMIAPSLRENITLEFTNKQQVEGAVACARKGWENVKNRNA